MAARAAWFRWRGEGAEASRPVLVLYTRNDCHLCGEAKATLERLTRTLDFEVEERNVDGESEWLRRFGDEVPVGVLDGRKIFKFRVDPEKLGRALARRR